MVIISLIGLQLAYSRISDAWDHEQYDSLLTVGDVHLRDWLTAVRSEINPGNNAWPSCSSCAPLMASVTPIIDSCPGYTVEEVFGRAVTTLTFIRSVEATADGKCCSIDGESCVSSLQYDEDISWQHQVRVNRVICDTARMCAPLNTGRG